MASDNLEAVSSFIEGAPPGEVRDPTPIHHMQSNAQQARRRSSRSIACSSLAPKTPQLILSADIKALTADEPALLRSAAPAFERYNEEQLATTKLPGGSQSVGARAVRATRLTDGSPGARQQVQLAGRRPVL